MSSALWPLSSAISLKSAQWRGSSPPPRAVGKAGEETVVTPGKLERARALLAQGLNVREAATRLKIGKTALYDALANAKSP